MNCAFGLSGSGHSSRGFRMMKLSATLGGAASVATSAVPILANTRSTSGSSLTRASSCCCCRIAWPSDVPGNAQRVHGDVAFIQVRHELRAHPCREPVAQHESLPRAGHDGPGTAQGESRAPAGRCAGLPP